MSFPSGLLVIGVLVLGVALAVSGAPRQRRPRLAARLDPYLRGLQPARTRLLDAGDPPLTPLPALERLLRQSPAASVRPAPPPTSAASAPSRCCGA
jgi:hypothetical protein